MSEIFKQYFIAFSFIGIISTIPIIGFLSTDKEMSSQENRNLAQWPKVNEPNYFSKIDDYLSDHFGGRDFFVRMHKKIKKQFFKQKGGLKAVEGKNGWAFYEGCIKHYEGKINNGKINGFIDKIRNLKQNFPNMPIVMVVVPNKAFIYSENLPDYVIKSPKRFNTIEKLKFLENIYVLDLYSVLKSSKEKTFMKNDTHWNGVGAYIAYKEIIGFVNMNTSFNLKIKEDVKEIKVKNNYSGDISKMLGEDDTFIEKNNKVIFRNSFAQSIEKPKSKASQIPDFFNPEGNRKIILFHDSFSQEKLGEYLAETFNEIKTFWSFDFEKHEQYIKTFRPDMILIQIVDRHIQ